MPHLSRRRLNPKVERELLDSLEYVFTHSKPTEIKKILPALMTKTERLMVAKRLGIATLLEEEIPDSIIDDLLKVTLTTISKMRLVIGNQVEGYRLALKKLERRKTEQSLKDLLLQLTKYAVKAAGGRL